MSDRWSLSDKQVYGAEDDDDMDAILRAIDKAMDDEPTETPDAPTE